MVKFSAPTLDATFGALAHPIRRAILDRLVEGVAPIMELAAPFDVSLPAISRHLRVLEAAGLISREKEGRVNYVRLRMEPLAEASSWLSFYQQFWGDRMEGLDAYLQSDAGRQSGSLVDDEP